MLSEIYNQTYIHIICPDQNSVVGVTTGQIVSRGTRYICDLYQRPYIIEMMHSYTLPM